MNKKSSNYVLAIIFFLGLISFSLCITSEIKKTKRKDLKLDNKFCFLPESSAFGLGILAICFLVVAQVIGNFIVCRNFIRRRRKSGEELRSPVVHIIFMVLSWMSFGIAMVLISAATSMNMVQPYGKGWLDGECYLVKDGFFAGSAILVLVAVGSTILSVAVSGNKRTSQIVQSPKMPCPTWIKFSSI
ncbi:protein MODIFYING WALL LIGNIN-1-like [Impatiens glandulifera]|uniref:protein MODIFYING WALL LIGNIN-1-like n=1 Tax=Impatiens glandulifera TaxID=253017 RepID=UPI001FB0E888|nr:protein MODIFYING WALL LIGNIN-1-like [Impatiens glandulifera]